MDDARLDVQVINLDPESPRFAGVSASLSDIGLKFRRLEATDGRGLPPSFDQRYAPVRTRLWFGVPLTGPEVGVFDSHLRAAASFLSSGAEYGLVLEDDAQAQPGTVEVLPQLLTRLDQGLGAPWDCINLVRLPDKSGYITPIAQFENGSSATRLFWAHDFPLSAAALLWSKPGAERFVTRTHHFAGTVDNVLRSDLAWRGRGLCTDPPIFLPSGAESQIPTANSGGAAKSRWFKFRTRERASWRRRAAKFHRARLNRGLSNGSGSQNDL